MDFDKLFAETQLRWERDQIKQAHMTEEEREEYRLERARKNEAELARLGIIAKE